MYLFLNRKSHSHALFFRIMPLAWEARLTQKEAAAFKTLYGEVTLSERSHMQLFRLILKSRAAGTVSSYVASINR